MKSTIIINAVKILGYLIENNAIAGGGVKGQNIFDSLDITAIEFDTADTYLLEQQYVDGSSGVMDGHRWVTGSGVEFYQENESLLEVAQEKKEFGQMPDIKKVFVVHGRDGNLRNDFFNFLRALGLHPIEWAEALKSTGKATPYIGDVLESAFKNAKAVIVLLSPDDEVRLSPELWKEEEDDAEKNIQMQARPNVLFEAGMAFGTHPDRTLLIEVGQTKAFSDVAGRHVVRLSNSPDTRNEIVERLRTAGCDISTSGNDWLNVGDFNFVRVNKNDPIGYSQVDLTNGDIIAFLEDWWPQSTESVPENVTVNYNEIDKLLMLPPGSTKKHIGPIATRKNFKCISSGNVVAVFEYDVDIFSGSYSEPILEPDW
ncbi:TIR domain-containing protein [Thermodesulfobacteriota bacterium]